MNSAARHLPTRFAIVKRAEKILKEVDDYFEDAANFGLTVEEADPRGELVAIRKGIIAMLERENMLKRNPEGTRMVELWRHKKRGTLYEIVGEATLQTADTLRDNAVMVIYRGEDGRLWVRDFREFHDGRFEKTYGAPLREGGAR